MEWFDPICKLPMCNVNNVFERVRCLAYCSAGVNEEEERWSGYLDVYFDPSRGWGRCEESLTLKKTPFTVHRWTKWPGIPDKYDE